MSLTVAYRARRILGPEPERFWPKVDKHGPRPAYAPQLGRCWLWTAAQNGAGYGAFRTKDRRTVRAHRWAWEAEVGPIPPGLQIDHLCRVRHCVRPSHLEVVTNLVNSQRGLPGGRSWRKQITHCPQGHAYDEANTYLSKRGQRSCRTCRTQYAATRRQFA